MKKTLYLFIATVICTTTLSAQVKMDKRFAGLEQEINKILKDNYAAGVAIAVVEKNKVIFSKGFGYRDVANKFNISITKLKKQSFLIQIFNGTLWDILGHLSKYFFLDKFLSLWA